MKVVETERLILREFSLNDAPFILELVNDPSWLQFIGDRDVHTLTEARLYLQTGPLDSYQRFGFGLYLTRLKKEGTPIGMCGFVKRPSLPHVDIGYALLPQFTGRGFAFEAATAVMNYGNTVLGLKRLAAVTAPDNVRSINLLERLGFHFEKMVRLAPEAEEIRLYMVELI